MINVWGISYFSTIVTMLWRYNNSASFITPSGISTLPVVRIRFLKPILRNKLCAQCKESKSMWLKLYWGIRAIKAFAADMATATHTSPPVIRRDSLYSLENLRASVLRSSNSCRCHWISKPLVPTYEPDIWKKNCVWLFY